MRYCGWEVSTSGSRGWATSAGHVLERPTGVCASSYEPQFCVARETSASIQPIEIVPSESSTLIPAKPVSVSRRLARPAVPSTCDPEQSAAIVHSTAARTLAALLTFNPGTRDKHHYTVLANAHNLSKACDSCFPFLLPRHAADLRAAMMGPQVTISPKAPLSSSSIARGGSLINIGAGAMLGASST